MSKTSKRTPKLTDKRLYDIWHVRGLDYGENELADFDMLISSAVSRCCKDDKEDRTEIASMLSYLLGEEVSVWMLDAYSSEARRDHRISAHRFLALIAMMGRFDVLDAILREIGGKAIDRVDAKIFRVGKSLVENITAERNLQRDVDALYSKPIA